MEQLEVPVESVEELMEYLCVLLSEEGCVEFGIGYGLRFLLSLWSPPQTVERIGVGEYYVQPNVGLDLLEHVCEVDSGYALDRLLLRGERLEEGDHTLGDSSLLALFVDVNPPWVEEHDFGIGELLLLWLGTLGLEGGVHKEEGPNFDLTE